MVPPYSLRIPRVRRYSGYRSLLNSFTYRTFTFSGAASHLLLLPSSILNAVLTPQVFLPAVWPLSLSLATTREISVDFFSSAYLDVSVRRVPPVTLCIHVTVAYTGMRGFPIRKSADITAICASPRLIAACHVLRRLPMPRHSPCALISLNSFEVYLPIYLHELANLLRCNLITLLLSLERPLLISQLIFLS